MIKKIEINPVKLAEFTSKLDSVCDEMTHDEFASYLLMSVHLLEALYGFKVVVDPSSNFCIVLKLRLGGDT